MSNNIFFERGQMADKPNNYLWDGDCLELMKDIPDKSMDAIICDLPYGTTACKWDSVIPFEPLWEQYKRIIKDNGAIVLFGSQPFTSALVMSNTLMYKHSWVWNKRSITNPFQAKYAPLKCNEDILIFGKKRVNYYPQKTDKPKSEQRPIKFKPNYGGDKDYKEGVYGKSKKGLGKDHDETKTNPKTILEIPAVYKKHTIHPTQKPLELLKYLVKTYTNENDWVLDNTCGSNTTGIACYDLNRNYIGIEKDIDIYNVAKKRVEENILLRANEPKTLFDDKH